MVISFPKSNLSYTTAPQKVACNMLFPTLIMIRLNPHAVSIYIANYVVSTECAKHVF